MFVYVWFLVVVFVVEVGLMVGLVILNHTFHSKSLKVMLLLFYCGVFLLCFS